MSIDFFFFYPKTLSWFSFQSVHIRHNELPDFQVASWLGQAMEGYIMKALLSGSLPLIFSAFYFYIFMAITSTSRDPQESQDDDAEISWGGRDFLVASAANYILLHLPEICRKFQLISAKITNYQKRVKKLFKKSNFL